MGSIATAPLDTDGNHAKRRPLYPFRRIIGSKGTEA
jgi:hypothetical protein